MVMETTAKLNYFPAKGGCYNYFSPREILHHVKLNYRKHCSLPLLSYVLAHDEPTLTNGGIPALLAGVDDADNKDTFFAGVHDKDTVFEECLYPTPP